MIDFKKYIKRFFSQACPVCGNCIVIHGKPLCDKCLKELRDAVPNKHPRIVSAVSYKSSCCKKTVSYMKKNKDRKMFSYAAERIVESIKESNIADIGEYYITFPPRTPIKRLKHRFDHAEEISREVSKILFGTEERCLALFKRKIFTKEQKSLNLAGRSQNVRNCFSIKKDIFVPQRMIIIDDVATTGSTLEWLRIMLISMGAEDVILCSFALNDIRSISDDTLQ